MYDPNYSAVSLDEAYADLTEYLAKRLTLEESKRTFQKNVFMSRGASEWGSFFSFFSFLSLKMMAK